MIGAALLAVLPALQGADVRWTVPEMYIEGEPFNVTVEISASAEARTPFAGWLITPAGFLVNGRPVAKRTDDTLIHLEAGAKLALSYDLASSLLESEGFIRKNFRIGFGVEQAENPIEVTFLEAAEKGIDFMTLPVEQLGNYEVILQTSRGTIWVEVWPDAAPNHVRNFLDLSYTGFYDATLFHRVVPTFMIQGGRAKPGSQAPRTVAAEFSDKKHVPGVLSAARGDDLNSASSEFFIVHGPSASLNGTYSAFGMVVSGFDVVDKIARSGDPNFRPTDTRGHKPPIDQVIEKAIVVKAAKRRAPDSENR